MPQVHKTQLPIYEKQLERSLLRVFLNLNKDISATKDDMDTFESALESWDFILYDGKIFGYYRIFYGTQNRDGRVMLSHHDSK